jgi:hypothetical protein
MDKRCVVFALCANNMILLLAIAVHLSAFALAERFHVRGCVPGVISNDEFHSRLTSDFFAQGYENFPSARMRWNRKGGAHCSRFQCSNRVWDVESWRRFFCAGGEAQRIGPFLPSPGLSVT